MVVRAHAVDLPPHTPAADRSPHLLEEAGQLHGEQTGGKRVGPRESTLSYVLSGLVILRGELKTSSVSA